jgi:uncharacterized protein YcnI
MRTTSRSDVGPLGRLLAATSLAAMAMVFGAAPALAHAQLTPSEAPEGSTQTFTIIIEHDCGGSPTSRVSIDPTAGLDRVIPVAPEGWQATVDGGVVTWTADAGAEGSAAEFAFEARVFAAAGTPVPVPIVQECFDERLDWIEVAAPGQDPGGLAEPAPLLTVTDGTPVETTTSTAAPTTTVAPTTTAPTTTPTTTPSGPTTTAAPGTTTAVPTTTAAPPGEDDGGSVAPLVIGAVAVIGVAAGATIALRRRNDT